MKNCKLCRHKNYSDRNNGFTLIELLMVIVIAGILSAISINYFNNDINEIRYEATKQELENIKNALIGDEQLNEKGTRINFGIQGDIGAIPTSLDRLISIGTLTANTFDSTANIQRGWRGPYVTAVSGSNSISSDEWGNPYVVDLVSNPITITSRGADNANGGSGLNTDITISIDSSLFRSTVSGIITDGGNIFSDSAEIELFVPNGSGGLQTLSTSITAVAKGAFSFNNVSFGIRSIKIYIPSKAGATRTIGPIVFTVDRSSILIPKQLTDLLARSAGCQITADINYVSGGAIASSGFAGNQNRKYITLNYNVNTALSISKISALWAPTDRTLDALSLNGTTIYCAAGTYRTSPCNVTTGTPITIVNNAGQPTPLALVSGQNLLLEFYFSANLTNGTPSQSGRPFLAFFEHTNGCSMVYVNVP